MLSHIMGLAILADLTSKRISGFALDTLIGQKSYKVVGNQCVWWPWVAANVFECFGKILGWF